MEEMKTIGFKLWNKLYKWPMAHRTCISSCSYYLVPRRRLLCIHHSSKCVFRNTHYLHKLSSLIPSRVVRDYVLFVTNWWSRLYLRLEVCLGLFQIFLPYSHVNQLWLLDMIFSIEKVIQSLHSLHL